MAVGATREHQEVGRHVAVVGTGSWGITLAVQMAARQDVWLLTRTAAEADALAAAGESPRLPGVRFPERLTVTSDPSVAIGAAAAVMLVVPAQTMRQNVRLIRPYLPAGVSLISASKGLEIDTMLRMSQVIAAESGMEASQIAALSGPNLAREVAEGRPASSVVASINDAVARAAQALLMSPSFRVYSHSDIVGVELGGALKNVIALGAGMCDGLRAGDNAKAALMTRGLAEMARLGRAAGAEPLTFAGLAGLGDLIATCMSPLSRNRTLGEQLARGRTLQDVQAETRQVAEGVPTTVAARQLARRFGVELPITELMHDVLFGGLAPQAAGVALMQRDPKAELAGLS